jgi:hypothetical protein
MITKPIRLPHPSSPVPEASQTGEIPRYLSLIVLSQNLVLSHEKAIALHTPLKTKTPSLGL